MGLEQAQHIPDAGSTERVSSQSGIIIYGNNHASDNIEGAISFNNFLSTVTDQGDPTTLVLEQAGSAISHHAFAEKVNKNGLVYALAYNEFNPGGRDQMPMPLFRELVQALREGQLMGQSPDYPPLRHQQYYIAHYIDKLRQEGRPITIALEGPYKKKTRKKLHASEKAINANASASRRYWESGNLEAAEEHLALVDQATRTQLQIRDKAIALQCSSRKTKKPDRQVLQVIGAQHLPGIETKLEDGSHPYRMVYGISDPRLRAYSLEQAQGKHDEHSRARALLLHAATRRLRAEAIDNDSFHSYTFRYETARGAMIEAIERLTREEINSAAIDESLRTSLEMEFVEVAKAEMFQDSD